MERDGGEIQLRDQDGNFNSHAHVERDAEFWKYMRKISISTHTLTWSVTRRKRNENVRRQHFNSHAHVERDKVVLRKYLEIFISTHTLTWSVTLDVVYIWCLLNVMRTYFFI